MFDAGGKKKKKIKKKRNTERHGSHTGENGKENKTMEGMSWKKGKDEKYWREFCKILE